MVRLVCFEEWIIAEEGFKPLYFAFVKVNSSIGSLVLNKDEAGDVLQSNLMGSIYMDQDQICESVIWCSIQARLDYC